MRMATLWSLLSNLPQSRAQKSFAVAQKLIADAQRAGAVALDLSVDFRIGLTHLKRVPNEISGLTGLRELTVTHAPISDISRLSVLSSLTLLNIRSTNVANISPISDLHCLKT